MKSSVVFFGLLFCHLACSACVPIKDRHDDDGSDGSAGVLGIDVSSLVTQQQFENLVAVKNFKYLIVRAFRSLGAVDTNAPVTIRNARAAGISDIDVYLFPKPGRGDPETQVTDTIDYLAAQGTEFGTLWIDVEPLNWFSNKTENQKFFTAMFIKAKSLHQTGVYTSIRNWGLIMGEDFTGGSSAPLWYPRYESNPNPSFSDFTPFGGWSTPAMKQFTNSETIAGATVDQNWRP
ncbi:probable GH family 25 lysozyme 2 [Oscarella lobularis]|uniref:probable GH family 25 lysozyme 2 n=1 Tax=Oscarella lobularis TaxID=121494 RepID=UPI00331355A2